jgi:hypothetical protein
MKCVAHDSLLICLCAEAVRPLHSGRDFRPLPDFLLACLPDALVSSVSRRADAEPDIIRIGSLYRTLTPDPIRSVFAGRIETVGPLFARLLRVDEITSALDVTIQAQSIELLNRMRERRGVPVILISHDLALVRSFCDQVIVFQSGKVVEQGSVSNVLEQPQENYTPELLRSAPTL